MHGLGDEFVILLVGENEYILTPQISITQILTRFHGR